MHRPFVSVNTPKIPKQQQMATNEPKQQQNQPTQNLNKQKDESIANGYLKTMSGNER